MNQSQETSLFAPARWIWTKSERPNQYVVFARTVEWDEAPLPIQISASSHYELFLNGEFVARGPVHGDPQWCQYDELLWTPREPGPIHIAVVVHHESAYVHCLLPTPGGFIAAFGAGDKRFGTDESWKCLDLEMWSQNVSKRNWALGFGEDYDARLEPNGWDSKIFNTEGAGSEHAVLVPDSQNIWDNYQKRITPFLQRRLIEPVSFDSWQALGAGASELQDASRVSDEEELRTVAQGLVADLETINGQLAKANALTFDLGQEYVGFYFLDVEAPEGTIIEISGAELLREGRPWIYRKDSSYTARYTTKAGRARFTTFSWSGFRYLHLVVRGGTENIQIHAVGCLERKVPLRALRELEEFKLSDEKLQRIFDLCRRTLEVGVQEHLIDCPTREQAQYWGDGVFIAASLWKGWGERSYMQWFLEGFLHAPFRPDGQMTSVYPGNHIVLLDYALIALEGQRFWKDGTGAFYKTQETLQKALKLKSWFDAHLNADGLVDFDYEAFKEQYIINFIDHPGLGWHNFPHVGIDRHGTSCPLNLFFYGFLHILSGMAHDVGAPEAQLLDEQAATVGEAIRRTFFDGEVFHDARDGDTLSPGTSWHSNCLAVYFGLIKGEEAHKAMSEMLARYDEVCRCSPYFHFFFLPALRRAGLEEQAIELIKREWEPMLAGGATTTWEGFEGDAKDTLCHPWSTAPFLFLLESTRR